MTQTSRPRKRRTNLENRAVDHSPEEERVRVRDLLPTVIVVFLVLTFVQTFIGRMYLIPSASMEPTLHGCAGCKNDRILVQKLSYYFSDPQPGDVVVFAGADSWNSSFEVKRSDNVLVRGVENAGAAIGLLPNGENILVKRVIATEGQTVSCEAGDPAVMVDGQPIDQSYVKTPPEMPVDTAAGSEACGGSYFGPVTVPEGNIWVMGDNRTNSLDSRAHLGDNLQGTIPVDNVRGKVEAVVLPIPRAQLIDDPKIQHAAA